MISSRGQPNICLAACPSPLTFLFALLPLLHRHRSATPERRRCFFGKSPAHRSLLGNRRHCRRLSEPRILKVRLTGVLSREGGSALRSALLTRFLWAIASCPNGTYRNVPRRKGPTHQTPPISESAAPRTTAGGHLLLLQPNLLALHPSCVRR